MDELIQKFNALLLDKSSHHDLLHDGKPWCRLEWQHCEIEPYWTWWYEAGTGLDLLGLCQYIVSKCESPSLIEVVFDYSHASTSDHSMFRHLDLALQDERPVLLQMGFREQLTEEGPTFSWCPEPPLGVPRDPSFRC